MSEAGICKIKSEFILPECKRTINLNLVSERDKSQLEVENGKVIVEPPSKKRKHFNDKKKKKLSGQNKARGPTFKTIRGQELCDSLAILTEGEPVKKCERNNCQNLHDIDEYLKIKPKDIGNTCYNYQLTGKCIRGLNCKFAGDHITPEQRNRVDLQKIKQYESQPPSTKNILSKDTQSALRRKHYDFELTSNLIKYNDRKKSEMSGKLDGEEVNKTCGAITDEDIIKLKKQEKKKIAWNGKLFLSPLTTVGNLPFRRICKEYGADITCGEMAMSTSLLQGNPQEWALVKRHKSEDIFGVQLCGNNPHSLTKCGQILQKEFDIDFVDLNLGCPIDLVYREGGGCGLLTRKKVLESCIRNLSDILAVPLTVKTRTGIYKDQNIAHLLAPKFKEWGADLITIHGRSREQRYTKSSNWEYIRQVAQAAVRLPVFGNGDILSYYDYTSAMEKAPELAGIMIGRGALIKPWLFKEIKEQKLWDISSSERFDIIKTYVNYGLEHWGSDTKGVENTRRFLLEWLSFLYRYVPVGILENPPQKINERPPFFKGRDELETLMASPSALDWIKISEMLLGPVPENFQFLPKHKANSYT